MNETKLKTCMKILLILKRVWVDYRFLKDIKKQIKNIGGQDKYGLAENIENSITLHWLYMHRDDTLPYIQEFVI